MTDQESRYRCPGCGNEESGALVEAVRARPKGSRSVICPKSSCATATEVRYYQLIEEPEPEGAREWSRAGHRYPGGHWPSACGNVNTTGRTGRPHTGDLFAEPQGTPCPACLPKPGEGEVKEWGLEMRSGPIEWHRFPNGSWPAVCGRSVEAPRAFTGDLHADTSTSAAAVCPICLCVDEKSISSPPQPPEWVPPELKCNESDIEYMVRGLRSLAAHVTAMLARPTEFHCSSDYGGEGQDEPGTGLCVGCGALLSANQVFSLRQHFPDHCSWPCAAKDMAAKLADLDDWTSVEDGLPEATDPVESRVAMCLVGGRWRVSGDVTHWRLKPAKPEEG